MKRVLVRPVYEAFEYVMDHYYPFGQADHAVRKDTYAVISIQDTHTDGFGFVFSRNEFCRDVLTLYFDDIVAPVEGAVMFSDEMAEAVISFILENRQVETLLVHCYGGQSRSRALGAFAVEMLGGDSGSYFKNGVPNQHVYDRLKKAWFRRMITGRKPAQR